MVNTKTKRLPHRKMQEPNQNEMKRNETQRKTNKKKYNNEHKKTLKRK